ncbi:MAG: DUF3800 domain-containing protein [Candidatus Hydrogenedentes bacterium]|nr:DUF3800 domain-containing protein [Candidatus Hydrogenedentota bacterium]
MHSFRVYIDESGDEGFVFNSDGSGSRRWLVLSAVVVRAKNDLRLVEVMKDVRQLLGKQPKKQLHFTDLKHEMRVPYVRKIAGEPIRTVTVLIYKPSIQETEKFQTEKFLLYRYATRLLLERVSWLCRDYRMDKEGDGRADLIFSNRSIMSYEDLRQYLRSLQTQSDPLDVRIDWSVILPESVRAVNHDQLAGLQVADAVASSFYYAANVNQYGEAEDRYARLLFPTVYRHKGSVLGYGLKFWPQELPKLKSANPHLAWFADLPDK